MKKSTKKSSTKAKSFSLKDIKGIDKENLWFRGAPIGQDPIEAQQYSGHYVGNGWKETQEILQRLNDGDITSREAQQEIYKYIRDFWHDFINLRPVQAIEYFESYFGNIREVDPTLMSGMDGERPKSKKNSIAFRPNGLVVTKDIRLAKGFYAPDFGTKSEVQLIEGEPIWLPKDLEQFREMGETGSQNFIDVKRKIASATTQQELKKFYDLDL